MATVFREERSGKSGLILLLIIAIVLFAIAVGTLPFTKHADNSHADEKINASSMVAMVTAGTCRDMRVYNCPDDATIKILCKVGNNVVGGLVIGVNADGTHHVITGYAGRQKYWNNKVDGCYYMGGTFALQ